jgi:hypothetical protein
MRFNRVVLPAPRKPVSTVTGTRSSRCAVVIVNSLIIMIVTIIDDFMIFAVMKVVKS